MLKCIKVSRIRTLAIHSEYLPSKVTEYSFFLDITAERSSSDDEILINIRTTVYKPGSKHSDKDFDIHTSNMKFNNSINTKVDVDPIKLGEEKKILIEMDFGAPDADSMAPLFTISILSSCKESRVIDAFYLEE